MQSMDLMNDKLVSVITVSDFKFFQNLYKEQIWRGVRARVCGVHTTVFDIAVT